ncbi:MAG: UvrD-helicase domain-containing protein, partial [Muribaculaceae bacterium]
MNDNAQAMPLQIIKASAGSGKTFQLAYEYIKLLLGVKNADGTYSLGNRTEYHQHILAVTFTNKATGEMKSRIVNELWLLSQGKGDYIKPLTTELHTTPALLKKASRKALEEILFNYTTFNVSTIDSFFQTVLRTFAFELDQDYDYAVELDQKYSQAIAVQNMLLNVGSSSDSNDRVAQWLREYMLQKFYDSNLKSSSWNVFKSSGLGDMAANLSKEWFVKHRAEVEEYLQDVFEQQDASEKPQSQREPRIEQFKSQLKKMSADADKRIDEFANRFAEILDSVGLKVDGLSKVSGLACLKNPLINKDKADIGKIDDFIAKDVDVSKWSTDRNWKNVARTGVYDGAVAKMKELANDAIPVLRNNSLLKDMTNNLYLFGLLGVIGNEMEKFL